MENNRKGLGNLEGSTESEGKNKERLQLLEALKR